MKLNQSQLKDLLRIACQAATKAGNMIADSTGRNLDVIAKEAGSSRASQVVTEVDIKSQQIILELIEPTLKKYDLALLSEEMDDDGSRFHKDFFWAIDPLDGTLPFVENDDGFAVSIGLVSKAGVSVIGVVFDPTTSTLYHAIKGCGAFKNGIALKISNDAESYHFIVDKARLNSQSLPKLLEKIKTELTYKKINYLTKLSHAGAVMNVCWLMEKTKSCYFKLPKKKDSGGCIWDYSAVACIFSEAGGIVCDCSGEPLALNSIDSVFMNKKGILFATNDELKQLIIEIRKKLNRIT